METPRFAGLVSLACHDLRTPLATVNGFAKTLNRTGTLGERESHFVDLIDAAAGQMTALLDQLALAARIESGRYEPLLTPADTRELATSRDERVVTEGDGATIETDGAAVGRALDALARCAAIHGNVPQVTWRVAGRQLTLAPVAGDARGVILGESLRDLGALVARIAIERLGGSLALTGEELRVSL
jgi:signal transduction histidine kinase